MPSNPLTRGARTLCLSPEEGPLLTVKWGVVVVLLYLGGCCGAVPHRAPSGPQVGTASYYGKDFHGKKTASGEVYDMHDMTAAHKNLSFGTRIKVTNLENGKIVIVRINDRGPWMKGRILDLSYAAARRLDMIGTGTARVRIDILP